MAQLIGRVLAIRDRISGEVAPMPIAYANVKNTSNNGHAPDVGYAR
jgi:hypothetical protein